jgi:hypothetical protein
VNSPPGSNPQRWRMVKQVSNPDRVQSAAPDCAPGAGVHSVRVPRRLRPAAGPGRFWLPGDRTDPFYEVGWTLGGLASWLSGISRSRWLRRRGVDLTPDQAINRILTTPHRRDPYGFSVHLAALGVLHSFHTCTAEQLAALVGDQRLAGNNAGPLTLGVAAGLYDMGLLPLASEAGATEFTVFQLSDDPRRRSSFLGELSWMQWLACTGGRPGGLGPRHDRHNIHAAELALRLGEATHTLALLGERFSRHGDLATDPTRLSARDAARAADLTSVRPDGLRIAFEVTSTTSRRLRHKIRAWVRLLSNAPLDDWGPVVIFVVTVPPRGDDWNGQRRRVRRVIERAIVEAVRETPGTSFDRTASRIGVVDWTEWFPAAHTGTTAFKGLVARRWVPERQSWEKVAFADSGSFPFEPTDPIAGFQIVENAKLLGQSPVALRSDVDVEGVTRSLLQCYGLDPGSDHPALGAGRGATGDAQLPQALLGLASPQPHFSPRRTVSAAPATPCPPSPLDDDRELPPRLCRSACGVRVARCDISVEDVIEYAARHPDSPIGELGFTELLRAQPNQGDVRGSLRQLRRAARVLGEEFTVAGRTVRWLVDGRARGRRLAAWRDAGLPRQADPGFPWRHGPFPR